MLKTLDVVLILASHLRTGVTTECSNVEFDDQIEIGRDIHGWEDDAEGKDGKYQLQLDEESHPWIGRVFISECWQRNVTAYAETCYSYALRMTYLEIPGEAE